MNKEAFEQELNKKYGSMSVKEFANKFKELQTWLIGYLDMIYPSLDEEIGGAVFSRILLSDLCYSLGTRERLISLAETEKERMERKMSMVKNVESTVDNMLKNLGIRKENADDQAPFPNS